MFIKVSYVHYVQGTHPKCTIPILKKKNRKKEKKNFVRQPEHFFYMHTNTKYEFWFAKIEIYFTRKKKTEKEITCSPPRNPDDPIHKTNFILLPTNQNFFFRFFFRKIRHSSLHKHEHTHTHPICTLKKQTHTKIRIENAETHWWDFETFYLNLFFFFIPKFFCLIVCIIKGHIFL